MSPWRRASLARRLPEVLQTSGMDCGPAALKAFLAGFGIEVSYERLREVCQTDVDGSSIDTLEEVANQLGVEAEQVMIPVDHLLLPQARALPSILVVRLPGGLTHFVVAWRAGLGGVQVMDPASGRRRARKDDLLERVYVHRHRVPAHAWRAWAGGGEFLGGLERRMIDLGVGSARRYELLARAAGDRTWFPLAALDAAVRVAGAIVRSGARRARVDAAALIEGFFEEALREGHEAIPSEYWFARASTGLGSEAEEVVLQGAVLVRGLGTRRDTSAAGPTHAGPIAPLRLDDLRESKLRPARTLWRLVRSDGLLAPGALFWASMLGAGAVIVEAALFRCLLELGSLVSAPLERLLVLAFVLALLLLVLILDLSIWGVSLDLGRRLELRLRVALGEKLPRLADRYFASRLVSDLAERSHAVHRVRELPALVQLLLVGGFRFSFTAAAIAWLDPSLTRLVIVGAGATAVVPMAFRPPLEERDLRVRTHGGALSRYYFDALLGLLPLRCHGAEKALRTEHEGVLKEWYRSGLDLLRWAVAGEALQMSIGFLFAVALVFEHTSGYGGTPEILLLIYWALQLPLLGQQVGVAARRLSSLRSVVIRSAETLSGPEDQAGHDPTPPKADPVGEHGAALRLRAVTVRLGGRDVLKGLELDLPAGSHVAIVGPSGAGKSTLMGLLLGWYGASQGEVCLDGGALTPRALRSLRSATGWIDPEVQLWNRSLLENLLYGQRVTDLSGVDRVVREAELQSVVERLDGGLDGGLGEQGGLVSGGEGQRVRFARALHRACARLVILDEAFRGLDRTTRRILVDRARARWSRATVLCVTHDVEMTRRFPRVLVMEGGRLLEDGRPDDLLAREGSRYRALVEAERAVRRDLWSAGCWRRLWMERGRATAGRSELD